MRLSKRGGIRWPGAALLWLFISCVFAPAARAAIIITQWTLYTTAYGETNGSVLMDTNAVFPFSGDQFVTNSENRLLEDCTSVVSYTHSASAAYNFSLIGTTRVLQTVLSGTIPAHQDWYSNFWGPRIVHSQGITFTNSQAFYYSLRGHFGSPSFAPGWAMRLQVGLDSDYNCNQLSGNAEAQAVPLVLDLTNFYTGALSGVLPPGIHNFVCTEGISADFEAAGDSTDSGEIVLELTPTNGPVGLYLTGSMTSEGSLELTFPSRSGLNNTVLATTNLALPLSSWTTLGPAIESPAGLYRFVDSDAANYPQRFYRVRSP
jgi:hypothetical protein